METERGNSSPSAPWGADGALAAGSEAHRSLRSRVTVLACRLQVWMRDALGRAQQRGGEESCSATLGPASILMCFFIFFDKTFYALFWNSALSNR